MAKITFKRGADYGLFLERYCAAMSQGEVLEKAVNAGANIVADEIRANMVALPEDSFRRLRPGEAFSGAPKRQKLAIIESFGLTPIDRDSNGFLNRKAGFDGYSEFPSPKYPKGVPIPLIARAIESGSSVRAKTPFVRPAVNKTRKQAVAKMQEVLEAEMKKLEGGST